MNILALGLLTGFVAPWFFMLAQLKDMGYHADVVSAKRLYNDSGALITVLVLVAGVIGVVSDVLFNIVMGLVVFRELPRWDKKEFLFTGRVERWHDDATKTHPSDLTRRHTKGLLWAKRLNAIMPGHV